MIAMQYPSGGSLLPIPVLFPMIPPSAARFGRRTPAPHDRPAALLSDVHGINRRGAVVVKISDVLAQANTHTKAESKDECSSFTDHEYAKEKQGESSSSSHDKIGRRLNKALRCKKANTIFPLVAAVTKEFGTKDVPQFVALYVFGAPEYAEELLEGRRDHLMRGILSDVHSAARKRIQPLFKKLHSEIHRKLRNGELTATGVYNGLHSLGEREVIPQELWDLYDASGCVISNIYDYTLQNPCWREILISVSEKKNENKMPEKTRYGRPSKHDWAQISAILCVYMMENGEPDPKARGEQSKAANFIKQELSELGVPEPSDSDLRNFVKETGNFITKFKEKRRFAEK